VRAPVLAGSSSFISLLRHFKLISLGRANLALIIIHVRARADAAEQIGKSLRRHARHNEKRRSAIALTQ